MITRKTNLLSIICLITILFSGNHSKAGEPVKWTGWYVGIFGAYLSGELTSDDPSHRESTGDYNDDGPVNFADAISALHGSFGNGPLPPVPGHIDCGGDPTDDNLDCKSYSACP